MFKNFHSIASFVQLQFKSINTSLFLTILSILMKISATVIKIYKWYSKVYRFQNVDLGSWSPLWRQHRLLIVPVRLSRCWVVKLRISFIFAMASKQPWCQPGGLCNLRQANPWRRPPRWALSHSWSSGPYLTMRSSALQIPSEKLERTLWTSFMTIFDKWSECFIGDNWTCSPCCHGNLTCNSKYVIKYYFYVKFPQIFAHNVQMCAKLFCKISVMFAQCLISTPL